MQAKNSGTEAGVCSGDNTFTSGFEVLLGHADKNVKKKDLCLMEETLSGNRCREDSWSCPMSIIRHVGFSVLVGTWIR